MIWSRNTQSRTKMQRQMIHFMLASVVSAPSTPFKHFVGLSRESILLVWKWFGIKIKPPCHINISSGSLNLLKCDSSWLNSSMACHYCCGCCCCCSCCYRCCSFLFARTVALLIFFVYQAIKTVSNLKNNVVGGFFLFNFIVRKIKFGWNYSPVVKLFFFLCFLASGNAHIFLLQKSEKKNRNNSNKIHAKHKLVMNFFLKEFWRLWIFCFGCLFGHNCSFFLVLYIYSLCCCWCCCCWWCCCCCGGGGFQLSFLKMCTLCDIVFILFAQQPVAVQRERTRNHHNHIMLTLRYFFRSVLNTNVGWHSYTADMEYGKHWTLHHDNGGTYGNGVALCFWTKHNSSTRNETRSYAQKTICFTFCFWSNVIGTFFLLELFYQRKRERNIISMNSVLVLGFEFAACERKIVEKLRFSSVTVSFEAQISTSENETRREKKRWKPIDGTIIGSWTFVCFSFLPRDWCIRGYGIFWFCVNCIRLVSTVLNYVKSGRTIKWICIHCVLKKQK